MDRFQDRAHVIVLPRAWIVLHTHSIHHVSPGTADKFPSIFLRAVSVKLHACYISQLTDYIFLTPWTQLNLSNHYISLRNWYPVRMHWMPYIQKIYEPYITYKFKQLRIKLYTVENAMIHSIA